MNTIRIIKNNVGTAWSAFINIYQEDKDRPGNYSYVKFERGDASPLRALGKLIEAVKDMIGVSPDVLIQHSLKGYGKCTTLIGMPAHGRDTLYRIDNLDDDAVRGLWVFQNAQYLGLDILFPKKDDEPKVLSEAGSWTSIYVYPVARKAYTLAHRDRREMEILQKFDFHYDDHTKELVLHNDPA